MLKKAGVPAVTALCLSLVAVTGAMATEPSFRASDLEPGEVVRSYRPQGEICSFTQSTEFDLETGALACGGSGATTDNQYLRVFDLDGEHGLGGEVCVNSLDYAVEQSSGETSVTFYVYCVAQGLADSAPAAGIDRDVDLDPGLVFSTTIAQPDAEFEYFNQPLGGCCDADLNDMAIEIASEDCLESGNCVNFFPGVSGFVGSTKPYYIGAPDCGLVDPINADNIDGLGVMKLVMVVNATCEELDDEVPASSRLGVAILLLLVLATGMYFVRR